MESLLVSVTYFQSVFDQRLCMNPYLQWGFHSLLIDLYAVCGMFSRILHVIHWMILNSCYPSVVYYFPNPSDCDLRMSLLGCLFPWFSLLDFLLFCLFTCIYSIKELKLPSLFLSIILKNTSRHGTLHALFQMKSLPSSRAVKVWSYDFSLWQNLWTTSQEWGLHPPYPGETYLLYEQDWLDMS